MDIDIDFPSTFDPTKIFNQVIPASMVKDDDLVKHPCGHYFQTIPIDSVTKLAAIPYEEADVLGYFKIDFLHLYILDHFSTKQEIRELVNKEPNWKLLQDPDIVEKLFQLNKQYHLLTQIKPCSVQELADVVAMIRPGKRQLLEQYLNDTEKTRPLLYRQSTDDKSSFRRSHAIAYALTIVLQLHLIERGDL